MGRTTAAAVTAPTVAAVAPASLVVTVAGTQISSVVDANGRFTLTGVAPGRAQLVFSGSGINATLTLDDIADRAEIHIVVLIDGSNAVLEADDRQEHDDDAAEHEAGEAGDDTGKDQGGETENHHGNDDSTKTGSGGTSKSGSDDSGKNGSGKK